MVEDCNDDGSDSNDEDDGTNNSDSTRGDGDSSGEIIGMIIVDKDHLEPCSTPMLSSLVTSVQGTK